MATAGSGATGPSYTSPGIPGGGFTGAGLSGARRASPNNSKRDLLPPPAGGHSGGAGAGGGSGGNPLGGNPMARTRSSQEPVRLVPQMGSAEESAQAGAAPSPLPATAGALGAGPSGAGGGRGGAVLAPSLSFANGVGSGMGAVAAGGAGVGAGTGMGAGAPVGGGGCTGSGTGAAGGASGAKEKESLRVQALSNAIRHNSHGGEKDRDSYRDKEPLGRSTTQYSEEGGSAAAVAGSAVAATAGFGGSARGLGGGFASDTASDTAAGQVHGMRDGSFPPSPAPDKSWYAVSPLVDFHPGSSPPPPFMPGQSPLRDSAFKLPLPAVGGNGAGNSGHEGLGEIRTEDGQIGGGGTGDGELSMDGGKGVAAEGSSHEEAPCSKNADTLCGEDDDDPNNAGSGSSPSRPSGPDGPVGNPRRRAERSGAGNRPGTGSYLPIYRQIGVPRSSSHDPASLFAQKQHHAGFTVQEWEEALKDGSGGDSSGPPSGGTGFGRSNSGGGGGGGGRAAGSAVPRGGGGASGMPRGGAGASPFSIQGKVVSGAGRSMMMPPRNSSVPAALPTHKGTATGLQDSARGGGRQLRAFASAAPGRMDGPAALGSELGRRDSYNLILDQFLSTDGNASGPDSPGMGMGPEERRGPAEIGGGVELRRVVTTGRQQRAERGGADVLVVECGGDGGNADGSVHGGGRMHGGIRLHGSNSFHGQPSSGGAAGGGFDGSSSTTAPTAPAAAAASGGAASAISQPPHHPVHHPACRQFPRSSSDSGRKSSPSRRSPSSSPSRGVGTIGGSNLAPPPLVSPHHLLDGGAGLGMGGHSAASSWTGEGMGGGVVGGFGGAAAAGAGNSVPVGFEKPRGVSPTRGAGSILVASSGKRLSRQSSGSVGDGVDYSSSFESYSTAAGADVARDGMDGDSDHGQVNGQRKLRGQALGGSGNGRQKHRRAVSDNECAQPGEVESGEGEEGGREGVGEGWADGQVERGMGGRRGGGEGGTMHGGGWEEGGEDGGADVGEISFGRQQSVAEIGGSCGGMGGRDGERAGEGGGEEDGGGEEEESDSGSVVEWALAGSPQSISAVAEAAEGGRGGGGGGAASAAGEGEGVSGAGASGTHPVWGGFPRLNVEIASLQSFSDEDNPSNRSVGSLQGMGSGRGVGSEQGMDSAQSSLLNSSLGKGAGGGVGEVGKQYALTADDWLDYDPPGDALLRRCVHRASGTQLMCRTISKQSIRSQQQAEAIGVEVAVMEVLQPHAHIVGLRDKFESLTSVHLILDPMARLSLHDRMRQHGPIPQHHAAPLCLALLHALHHCHSQGVAHRNLTPHAVVFPTDDSPLGDARLSGFEWAAFVTPGVPFSDPVSLPLFAAPEVHAGRYGTQADLWSLGVLLFLLLCGVPPFWAATGGGIRRAVQQQQVAFLSPRWKEVSDEMKQLLLMLLEKNPSDRLTAAEALVIFLLLGTSKGGVGMGVAGSAAAAGGVPVALVEGCIR
ncbi:unnamed protein product [Closterium sp. NIES-65]|nr:unnamed protein product [Closterium sp. NIES-65]